MLQVKVLDTTPAGGAGQEALCQYRDVAFYVAAVLPMSERTPWLVVARKKRLVVSAWVARARAALLWLDIDLRSPSLVPACSDLSLNDKTFSFFLVIVLSCPLTFILFSHSVQILLQ